MAGHQVPARLSATLGHGTARHAARSTQHQLTVQSPTPLHVSGDRPQAPTWPSHPAAAQCMVRTAHGRAWHPLGPASALASLFTAVAGQRVQLEIHTAPPALPCRAAISAQLRSRHGSSRWANAPRPPQSHPQPLPTPNIVTRETKATFDARTTRKFHAASRGYISVDLGPKCCMYSSLGMSQRHRSRFRISGICEATSRRHIDQHTCSMCSVPI